MTHRDKISAPRPAAGSGRQRNSFDSLRLIGALAVLFGHAYIITGSVAPVIGTIEIQSIGVCIFFALSGFLITQSWMSDSHLYRFLLRRILRILPALIVVTACTALVIGAVATTEPLQQYFRHGWTWRYIVSNSLLVTVWGLPGVFDTLPIRGQSNGSLWTLPIEFGLYLIVPAIVAMHRHLGRAAPIVVIGLAMVVITIAPRYPGLFLYNFLGIDVGKGLSAAPYFWVGSALRLVDFGTWDPRHRRIALAASAAVLALWAVTAAVVPLAVAMVAIVVLVLSIGLTDWLHAPLIERVGDLSYGTYLWAFPLQQLVMYELGGGVVRNLLIAAPATLLIAFASWHCVERQALRLKPRRRTRPAEEQAPVDSAAALQSPQA